VSFRARMTLLVTGAVAIAIVFASAGLFVIVRDQLYGGVDSALHDDGVALNLRDIEQLRNSLYGPDASLLGSYPQIVLSDGDIVRSQFQPIALPVTSHTLEVARSQSGAFYTSADVQGTHLRIYTVPYHLGRGFAIQVARPLDQVDRAVNRTRKILLFASLGGIGLAAILGLLVSGAAIAPIRRLTRAT